MKELLALEQELKEIQEKGKQRIAEYQAEIKTAIDNEEEANRAVVRAKQGDDPKVYKKAIEDKRTAKSIAEYYHGKIEQLKAKPYITEEEYRAYTKRINEEMDKINSEGKVKASKLFKELEAIKEEVAPAYAKANDLLRELQNNIYKHSYEKVMEETRKNKTPLNTNELHNEYRDNSLVIGIDHILKSQTVQNIGGSK